MDEKLNAVDKAMLEIIAGIKDTPKGAYNIRKDSGCSGRASSENIKIENKADNSGIDIFVAAGCKNEICEIPVIITESGLKEAVYNDFYVGEGADVTIIAGCGIHNCGTEESRHEGIHTFHISNGARVHYIEKHYGEGDGNGKNVMNPVTTCYLEENAFLQMDTSQIAGIDSTDRKTSVFCGKGSEVVMTERLLTHGQQRADSVVEITLNGEDSKGRVISRSVAQDDSIQNFYPKVIGNNRCFGHVQCDTIIMGNAHIVSIPALEANSTEAQLIHEAAIGKIAGDQILKLQTLGLSEEEAEDRILKGFLA